MAEDADHRSEIQLRIGRRATRQPSRLDGVADLARQKDRRLSLGGAQFLGQGNQDGNPEVLPHGGGGGGGGGGVGVGRGPVSTTNVLETFFEKPTISTS